MGVPLTPEEEQALKELATRLVDMNHWRKTFVTFTLWASSVIVAIAAGFSLWQNIRGK